MWQYGINFSIRSHMTYTNWEYGTYTDVQFYSCTKEFNCEILWNLMIYEIYWIITWYTYLQHTRIYRRWQTILNESTVKLFKVDITRIIENHLPVEHPFYQALYYFKTIFWKKWLIHILLNIFNWFYVPNVRKHFFKMNVTFYW